MSNYMLAPPEGQAMEKSAFTPEYQEFLRLLREKRLRAKVTQVELAHRLGQTQSWVSKCERGERRLDIVDVRSFCLAIGVPFVDFVREFDAVVGTKRGKPRRP